MPIKPTKPKTDVLAPEALRNQLIIMTRPGVERVSVLAERVATAGGTLVPLFGEEPRKLAERAVTLHKRGVRAPDLGVFHQVVARPELYPEIRKSIRRLSIVASVYEKPPADAPAPPPPPPYSCDEGVMALPGPPPAVTPDFSLEQKYLDAAPAGIDARYAWTRPGGDGASVQIVDIERAWRFTHEDLRGAGGVLGGFPVDCLRERNHGAAVLGILRGDANAFGVKGICPGATVRGYSTRTQFMPITQIPGTADTSAAIVAAADLLTNDGADRHTGHILLLELHRQGPGGLYIAIEWWPDDLAAIQHAVSLDLVVVEAAGNGDRVATGADLDSAVYDNPWPDFEFDPLTWKNPFRRSVVDSGAIVVGASVPPIGTVRVDRSRLAYSNYGSRVDVQGWGDEVISTGYGTRQGGTNEDRWYVQQFGATSGASAMVAGAVACIQGVRRQQGRTPLTSTGARALLVATGSAQKDDLPWWPKSQSIGPRPNLRAMLQPPPIRQGRQRQRRRRGKQRPPRVHVRRAGPDPKRRRRRRARR
jgi:hypothetical protein